MRPLFAEAAIAFEVAQAGPAKAPVLAAIAKGAEHPLVTAPAGAAAAIIATRLANTLSFTFAGTKEFQFVAGGGSGTSINNDVVGIAGFHWEGELLAVMIEAIVFDARVAHQVEGEVDGPLQLGKLDRDSVILFGGKGVGDFRPLLEAASTTIGLEGVTAIDGGICGYRFAG